MKILAILSSLILLLAFVSCKPKTSVSLTEIVVDPSQDFGAYDLAGDVESEFFILPLETTDSCLIGNIENITYANDLYYILDNNSIIYIFNPEGKFVSKLNKIGRASDEYINIRDFAVMGENIWTYDGMTFKLSCFDKNLNKVEDIQTNTVIKTIGRVGKSIYAAGNWFGFNEENFQVIEYDTQDREMKKMMQYPSQNQEYVALGIGRQLAPLADSCLFMQAYCDTLFLLNNGVVTPRYQYRFTERFINNRFTPAEYRKNGEKPELITGIYSIYQTPASVLIQYPEGNEYKLAIYNKKSETSKVYSIQFFNSAMGNLKMMLPYFTENQEIITTYTANGLVNYSDQIFDKNKFKNIADKQKIENVVSGLKEEDNPVVFRYKLKKDSRL